MGARSNCSYEGEIEDLHLKSSRKYNLLSLKTGIKIIIEWLTEMSVISAIASSTMITQSMKITKN